AAPPVVVPQVRVGLHVGVPVGRPLHAVPPAGHGGAGELGAQGGGVGVVEVVLDVEGVRDVDVAGEDQPVAGAGGLRAGDDAVAVGAVAVPGVHGQLRLRVEVQSPLGEAHLLGHHVPQRRRGRPAVDQPPLLGVPGETARRVVGLRTGDVRRVAVGLVGAVLAGVEDV